MHRRPASAISVLFEGQATPADAAGTRAGFAFASGMVDDPAPVGLADRVARQLSLDNTGAVRVNVAAGGAAANLIEEATIITAEVVAVDVATTAGATGILGFLDGGLIVSGTADGTVDLEISSDNARFGLWESISLDAATNEQSVALGGLPLWAEFVRARPRGVGNTLTVSIHRAR